MYFTQDSMLPENQEKLVISVAPYGPEWLPGDTMEEIMEVLKICVIQGVQACNLGLPILA